MRDLSALPKGHLHLHLEAGMKPTLLAELAAKYSIEVPKIRGFGNFTAFSATYRAATDVLREREDWERLADELCAEHVRDGAVYLELTFWAGGYRHLFPRDEDCWELVMDVFAAASTRHGLSIRWMPAVDRVFDSPEEGVRLAHMALAFKDAGVVSFGLHNDEVGFPATPFAEAFRIAADGGLLVTPHAGELEGPHHVVEAIDVLHADRILHGVRSIEQDGLPERLAELGICLDVCPTSNVMLSVVPDLASHPLPKLLDLGVRCSINADDPLLFGPGLLEEYEVCRSQLGLTDVQLASAARSSIECGGAPAHVRAAALAGIEAWLTS